MKSYLAFKYILKILFRDITSIAKDNVQRAIYSSVILLLLTLSSIATIEMLGDILKIMFSLNDTIVLTSLLNTLSNITTFIVAMLFIIFMMIVSSEDDINWQLRWLPLKRSSVFICHLMVNYSFVAVIVITIYTTALLPLLIVSGATFSFIIASFLTTLFQSALIFVLVNGISILIRFFLNILRTKFQKQLSIIILIIIISLYFYTLLDLDNLALKNSVLNSFSNLFYNFRIEDVITTLLITSGSILLIILALNLPFAELDKSSFNFVGKRFPVKNFGLLNIIKEFKLLHRNTEVLISLFVTIMITGLIVAVGGLSKSGIIILLCFSISPIAMYSFGFESNMLFLYKFNSKKTLLLFLFKYTSLLSILIIYYLLLGMFALRFDIETLVSGVLTLVSYSIIFIFLGMIFPLTKKNGINALIIMALFFGVIVSLYFIRTYFLTDISEIAFGSSKIAVGIILVFSILKSKSLGKEVDLIESYAKE